MKEKEFRSKGGNLLYKMNVNLTYTLPRLAATGIRVTYNNLSASDQMPEDSDNTKSRG